MIIIINLTNCCEHDIIIQLFIHMLPALVWHLSHWTDVICPRSTSIAREMPPAWQLISKRIPSQQLATTARSLRYCVYVMYIICTTIAPARSACTFRYVYSPGCRVCVRVCACVCMPHHDNNGPHRGHQQLFNQYRSAVAATRQHSLNTNGLLRQ